MRIATSVLFVFIASFVLARAQDGGMEVFEEVDPYTKGDTGRMRKLGYVAFGPFPWRAGERTVDVQQNMGGIPMLWVETAHFRIGSSLGTYAIPNDREEQARLGEEIGRLKKKLGRLRAPKKKLDPWLRLHLYAQRAEELHASFLEDFGLAPEGDQRDGADQTGSDQDESAAPKEKFLVLLCERKSEFGRYLKTYLDVENEYSYRWGWPGGGMFWGANVEAIRQSVGTLAEAPLDSMLHCRMASGLASNFVDGFEGNLWSAPRWLSFAAGHLYVRRIDARWVHSVGAASGQGVRDEDWKWEPRVRNLVKNDFYAKSADMFAWKEYADLNSRDHMVAWSRLDYLVNGAEGDLAGFLTALTRPVADAAALVEVQVQALAKCFEKTPDALDGDWAAWVKKTYKKR